jgi:DNA excision repair protein ERCC-2
MFSAELEGRELSAVRRAIHRAVPRCAKALVKLITGLENLGGAPANPQTSSAAADLSCELNLFPTPEASVNQAARPPARLKPPAVQAGKSEVSTCIELPASLIPLLEAVLAEAASWLTRNLPADFREDLLTLYFRLLTFRRTAELYDDHFVTIIENAPDLKVRLFCLDPSLLLRQALARGHAAIFFSATLTPVDYYRTLLGGTLEDPVCQLSSPFPPEHLAVLIQDRIQTDFKRRAGSVGEVAAAMATVMAGKRGNYLVYFPSYQYLRVVLLEFQTRYPSVPVLVQKAGLTESERDAFLAAFSVGSEATLAGFAVLGGIFGEGIDLVGERLIGAIIVGVGLPQLSIERDLIRDYFQRQSGAGFDYAYTFPGMNRVLQAVGRVVRSATDRGVVLLIDVRFSELRYRRLFPPWWQFQRVRNPASLQTAVDTFWTNSAR